MKPRKLFPSILVLGLLLWSFGVSQAQTPEEPPVESEGLALIGAPSALGTAIGYQGQLWLSGEPVNDVCSLQFSLWNALSGPSQIGGIQTKTGIQLDNGLFMISELDFGAGAFDGNPRWLEIAVKCSSDASYITLSPRAAVRPAPYALYAGNSDKLDGKDAHDFLASTGGRVTGQIDFLPNPTYNNFAIGVGAPYIFPVPPNSWFYIKDLNDSVQPLRFIVMANTGNVGIYKNLGVGTDTPAEKLHVIGNSIFETGGGSLSISTPGGWPGMIMFSPNGHRRDITFKDNGLYLITSGTSAAPANNSGIFINESGQVGIGSVSPQQRLHVSGISRFDVGAGSLSISTPGGWPGMIMFSPNGHRRDFTIADNGLYISTSSTSAAPASNNGLFIGENGNVGVGTTNPSTRLDVAGAARMEILHITGGSDLAEPFDILGAENVVPGMVVAIDPVHTGQLRIADKAYDTLVAGCVSGANGIQPGLIMSQQGTEADGAFPVALTGRVYCLADAAFGAISPGDLLTTSANPGYAMRAEDYAQAQGAIIGKAMSELSEGQGLVLVLITLQ
jgi:hypothetical protein